jgi:ribulose-5-phosphate 4-epimerase/fuculose-1-phosphate aldolase
LQPDDLCRLDNAGRSLDSGAPTKEVPLHLRMYQLHPALGAVVHLHSPHAVAVSILADVDPTDTLPALTPYHVMRVGRLPLVPYARPGSTELARLLALHLGQAHCALLANHGSLAGGADMEAAADAAEEIEQTARLRLLTSGLAIRTLSGEAVAELSSTASSSSNDRHA